MKLGKNFAECHSAYEADRWLNVYLGRNGRIHTNNILKKDVRLHSYVNDETMGALDNYAKHEHLNIYIKPLENDMFDDLSISVFNNNNETITEFPMKIKDGRDGVREFFKELYTKIDKGVNPERKPHFIISWGKTPKEERKMYFQNLKDRFHEYKMNKIRNFIDEHTNDDEGSVSKFASDILEELHFNELHN